MKGIVMVSVLASSVVDRGFEQIKSNQKFYLKSVQFITYNISSEELLKPTLHK